MRSMMIGKHPKHTAVVRNTHAHAHLKEDVLCAVLLGVGRGRVLEGGGNLVVVDDGPDEAEHELGVAIHHVLRSNVHHTACNVNSSETAGDLRKEATSWCTSAY